MLGGGSNAADHSHAATVMTKFITGLCRGEVITVSGPGSNQKPLTARALRLPTNRAADRLRQVE